MVLCENCYYAKPLDPKDNSWRRPGYKENRILCEQRHRLFKSDVDRDCFDYKNAIDEKTGKPLP